MNHHEKVKIAIDALLDKEAELEGIKKRLQEATHELTGCRDRVSKSIQAIGVKQVIYHGYKYCLVTTTNDDGRAYIVVEREPCEAVIL